MSEFEPASRLKQSTNSAHHYIAQTLTTAEQRGTNKTTSGKKIKSQNHTIEQHRHQPMDSSALNQMVINLFHES